MEGLPYDRACRQERFSLFLKSNTFEKMQNKTMQQLADVVQNADGVMSTVKQDGVSCLVLIVMSKTSDTENTHPKEIFQQSVDFIHNRQRNLETSGRVFFPSDLRNVQENKVQNVCAHHLSPRLHKQLQEGVAALQLHNLKQSQRAQKTPTAMLLRCECLVPGGGAHEVTSKVVQTKNDASAAHRVCFSILRIIPRCDITDELKTFLENNNIIYYDDKAIAFPPHNVALTLKCLKYEQAQYTWDTHRTQITQSQQIKDSVTWPRLNCDFDFFMPTLVFVMPIIWHLESSSSHSKKQMLQNFEEKCIQSRNKSVSDQEHEGLVVCTWNSAFHCQFYKLKFRNINLLAPVLSTGTTQLHGEPVHLDRLFTPFIYGVLESRIYNNQQSWHSNPSREKSMSTDVFHKPSNITKSDAETIQSALQNMLWWKKLQTLTQLGFVTSVAAVHMPIQNQVVMTPTIDEINDKNNPWFDKTLNIFASTNVERGMPRPKGLLSWHQNRVNVIEICNELKQFELLEVGGASLYDQLRLDLQKKGWQYYENILHNNVTTVILVWYMSYLLEHDAHMLILQQYWNCSSKIVRQMFSSYVLDSFSGNIRNRFCIAQHPVFAALCAAQNSQATESKDIDTNSKKIQKIYEVASTHITVMCNEMCKLHEQTAENKAIFFTTFTKIWKAKKVPFDRLATMHSQHIQMCRENKMVVISQDWQQKTCSAKNHNFVYNFTQNIMSSHYNLASLLASHCSIATNRIYQHLSSEDSKRIFLMRGPLGFDPKILTQLKLGICGSREENREMFVRLCLHFSCEECRPDQKEKLISKESALQLFDTLVPRKRPHAHNEKDSSSSSTEHDRTDQAASERQRNCAIC